MFPIIILFEFIFSQIVSVGPFVKLVLLFELRLPPFSLAPGLGLGVTDVEDWTKNPLSEVFVFVLAVILLLEHMSGVLFEEEVVVLVE